jgi:hypothetical protein
MTRFEFMNKYGALGVELGQISEAKFAQFIRYKVFCDLKSQGTPHTEAIFETALRCNCSEETVYKATYYFSENGKTDNGS